MDERPAKAEEHLDADVEVLAHKTWRVEDTSPATDAAPEQMEWIRAAQERSVRRDSEQLSARSALCCMEILQP